MKNFHRLKRSHKILLVVVIALVGVRMALPPVLKSYINSVLKDDIEGYTGAIADLDLSLYRGAYHFEGLHLAKIENKSPVPFVESSSVDFSIAWRPLLRGHVVGRVRVDGLKVNFVNGPTEAEKQAGVEGKGWRDAIDRLFPLEIEELVVSNSEVHFRDFSRKPEVDLFLRDLQVHATNLTNSENSAERLVSTLAVSAAVQEKGRLKVDGRLNILSNPPAFDYNLEADGIQLAEFNDFFKSYGGLDIASGRLHLASEAASVDGRIKGYVKPVITDLKVTDATGPRDDPASVSDVVAAVAGTIFRRWSKDKVAAKVPFEGPLLQPEIKIWSSIGSLISNAFGREVKPGTDGEISERDVRARAR